MEMYYMERANANRSRRLDTAEGKKKQKLVFFMLLFLFVLMIGLFSLKAFAYADESNDSERVKLYRSITIYAGDSLYDLSNTLMTPEYADVMSYAREVAFINHMDPDTPLIPGNHLIVPYYADVQ